MPPKKSNTKAEKPSTVSKTKEQTKPSKLEIKDYENKKVFENEKTEFLKKKKRRGKSQKDNKALPASMKNLISEYGDIMANVGAKDLSKYDEFKKYSKNKKSKK